MAKGSVRKKGKKWYYRFYVEDASGNLVQKEYAGTENEGLRKSLINLVKSSLVFVLVEGGLLAALNFVFMT